MLTTQYVWYRSKADLLRKLKTHALPFEQPQTYAEIDEDVHELEEEGVLYVISRPPTLDSPFVLHHLNPEAGRPVDEDIKALWESAGSRKRARK